MQIPRVLFLASPQTSIPDLLTTLHKVQPDTDINADSTVNANANVQLNAYGSYILKLI